VLPLTLALLGANEWIIIFLIVVIFFGAAKIPQLARSLGRAKGEFEKGARESKAEIAAETAAAQPTTESEEDARVRRAAKELGIPTEGRPLADVKKDLKTKMA